MRWETTRPAPKEHRIPTKLIVVGIIVAIVIVIYLLFYNPPPSTVQQFCGNATLRHPC